MAKRFIHSDQFSKVFNEYNLFEKIATLKEPDENIYNGDSVFYVCDPSYGNWIYAQGHLYGYNSAYDPSIIEIRQTIEDDELIYAGLFNDIYKKLKDVSLIIPTKTSDLINDSSFIPQQMLIDDEIVIAAALNQLHDYVEDVSARIVVYSAGDYIDINNGQISATYPIASSSSLGIIRVGDGLSIDASGILSTSIFIPTKTSELINDSSFVTEEKLLEDEAVIDDALNDLNDYIEDVSSRIIIYSASNFIDITNGVISTTYTAGNYIDISSNGQISATYTVATQSTNGLMSSEDKIKLDDLSNYVLPVADSETLGGIKVGDGLDITDEGILSVSIFIPTKTSELINDSSFVTQEQLEEDELVIAGNINDLYDLIEDVSSRVPTKTSELINDSSFITQDQLEEDELVISAALNQLDTQIQDISTKSMSYVAGRDIDISNGVISVKLVNPSTLQEIVNNYESRLARLEGIIAQYEQRLQNLEINGIITDL